MRASTITLAIAVVALSACGSDTSGTITGDDGETGEYTIDSETGSASMTIDTPEGEVSMRTGADVEIDLPDGFTIIDGAEISSTTIVDQAEGKGALVMFKSDKSPGAIADYYRDQAEAAGIDIQIETSINGGRMLGGESASGTTFSVSAYPSEGDDGEQTTVQLVVGKR